MESNIFDTVLIFEGGSMRAAYTSAVANLLLENEMYFDTVYGVSAGSSNAVNYLSRDKERTKASFTTFSADPHFGGMGTMLRHKGMFNAQYIYDESGKPGAALPYDFDTFCKNPAHVRVTSIARDTGEDLTFTEDDMSTLHDLMNCVRASSTLPFFMPPTKVNGVVCYDGGYDSDGGIPVERAAAEGFKRFFIVRTRPRGFRREEKRKIGARLFFNHRPFMRAAAVDRWKHYNATADRIDRLEAEGAAYVFYCDDLTLKGTERDVDLLLTNYEAGMKQAKAELPAWERFLRG